MNGDRKPLVSDRVRLSPLDIPWDVLVGPGSVASRQLSNALDRQGLSRVAGGDEQSELALDKPERSRHGFEVGRFRPQNYALLHPR